MAYTSGYRRRRPGLGAAHVDTSVLWDTTTTDPDAGGVTAYVWGQAPYRKVWFNGLRYWLGVDGSGAPYTMNAAGQVYPPGAAGGVAYYTASAAGEVVAVSNATAAAQQAIAQSASDAALLALPPGQIITPDQVDAARRLGIPLYQRADGNWQIAIHQGEAPPAAPPGPVARTRGPELPPIDVVDQGGGGGGGGLPPDAAQATGFRVPWWGWVAAGGALLLLRRR
jgi:hypothetical protein